MWLVSFDYRVCLLFVCVLCLFVVVCLVARVFVWCCFCLVLCVLCCCCCFVVCANRCLCDWFILVIACVCSLLFVVVCLLFVFVLWLIVVV